MRVENNSYNPKTSSFITKASRLKIQSFSDASWRVRNYFPSVLRDSRSFVKYLLFEGAELWVWETKKKETNKQTTHREHCADLIFASNLRIIKQIHLSPEQPVL